MLRAYQNYLYKNKKKMKKILKNLNLNLNLTMTFSLTIYKIFIITIKIKLNKNNPIKKNFFLFSNFITITLISLNYTLIDLISFF